MSTTRTRAKASTSAQATKSSKSAVSARKKTAPTAKARMSLPEVMSVLEKAGTAQARKTYARHGALDPMFGVSFATLKVLMKKIGVDHDLAMRLWDTGNFDARNLAFKIADPALLAPADLDRWSKAPGAPMCDSYVAMLAAEGPHGYATASRWLATTDDRLQKSAWGLVAQLAARDEAIPDSWFAQRLAEIEQRIHTAPNALRGPMNEAVIAIGGRSASLRKAALAAAKRIGPVEVDHGDTSCKTPEAGAYVEKMWAHAKAKGFESPAAQERNRESPRTRC